MPKDFEDTPKESAKERATRRWRNHQVEKSFKEGRAKPPLSASPVAKELEIAETITNKKPDGRGSGIRAQTKFAKYLRELMERHSKRNELLYALSIRAQRYRLLKEKLRRLELSEAQRVAQQNQGVSNV
jgi:hypothetical protein